MLAVVIAGWATARAMLWESPFPLELPAPLRMTSHDIPQWVAPPSAAAPASAVEVVAAPARRAGLAGQDAQWQVTTPRLPLGRPWVLPAAPAAPAPLALPDRGVVAGHQLLYLAALGRLPLPPGLAAPETPRDWTGRPSSPLRELSRSRWSGDAWVLVRGGSGGLGGTSGLASYGGSQAGAGLRFALAPASARAPQAHLRLARALGGIADSEATLGVSARPLASLPLRLVGEARVQRVSGRALVRPAASAVTELAPLSLPLGIEAEAYAQAGYVGGKNATGFFDAQAAADRRVVRAGPAELRLGVGAWAGGQEGAARLDLGPRASMRLRAGEASSRLALEWRFRVAGNARPASGPALTFSAGF